MQGALINALLERAPQVGGMVDFCSRMSDHVLPVLAAITLLMLTDRGRLDGHDTAIILDALADVSKDI